MNITAASLKPHLFNNVDLEISKDELHQKFIEAALELDAGIVEPYIPEDMELQDMDKYHFLSYLQGHFDSFILEHPEDYRVELADFKCGGCFMGILLAGFRVFNSKQYHPYGYFGYLVRKNELGRVKDIFVCRKVMKT